MLKSTVAQTSCASSYPFRDKDFKWLTFKSRSRSRSTIFCNCTTRWQLSNVFHICLLYLLPFERLNIFKFLPSKSMSRSRSANIAIRLFNGKYQNLPMSPTDVCASSNSVSDKKMSNLLLKKVDQMLAITAFDGKCQNR